ncbi:MAG TPA: AI-2E family transporter [Terriglobales bacterium]|nr:AI-2E family transporter [Terriglobales bacterium]
MTQSRLTLIVLSAMLVATLAIAIAIFWIFLKPAAFAAILGIGLFPLHSRMQRWVRSQGMAALLSTITVVLLFVLPAGFMAVAVSSEMASAGRYLAEKSQQAGGIQQLASHAIRPPMDWLERRIDLDKFGIRDWLESVPGEVGRALVAAGTFLVSRAAGFAGQTVVTFFVLFFLFRDGPALINRISSLMPLRAALIERLFARVRDGIVANLYGIVGVGIVQGFLTGLALWVLGGPSPMLLGALAGLSSLIPIVGTSLVWLPAALYLMAVQVWKGIALLLWGALIVGSSDHLVRPLIVQGRLEIHPLLLLFAMLGGVKVFGLLGIFLGPIVLSLAGALFAMIREEGQRAHAQSLVPNSS